MFPLSMQSWCMTTGTTNYGVLKPIGRMLSTGYHGLDRWLTLPRVYPRGRCPAAAEELLPPVPAVFKGADGFEEQPDLVAGYGVSKRQPPVFKPNPRGGVKKWVDFVAEFWHCRCVVRNPQKAFTNKYQRWCRKHGYNFSEAKAHTGTPRPADTLTSYRNLKRPSCSWNRLYPNSGRLLPRLRLSNTKCNHWLPSCRNIHCHGSVRRRPDSGAAAHS